jgi:hypothetical protein
MRNVIRFVVGLALLLLGGPALSQEYQGSGREIFGPGLVAPGSPLEEPSKDPLAIPTPYSPPPINMPDLSLPAIAHPLTLEARLVPEGPPVGEGIIWRVFGPQPGPDGKLPLLATARGGTTTVQLPPGDYLVHAGFGRAAATKRISLSPDNRLESVILNAGGLKLDAVVGDDRSVPPQRLSFEILQQSQTGELVTVVPEAAPGLVVRLAAGSYHVISRYGDVNAVVRADLNVEAGKLTEAVMRHSGAEVTMKLVSSEGGEALANTEWTVLTEVGDSVHESTGAFPSMVLAEGNYTAVAKHSDQIYSRDFTVEAGGNRDVEVLLSDLVRADQNPAPNAKNAPPRPAPAAPPGP